MRFTVRDLTWYITALCLILGSYQMGKSNGKPIGYREAVDANHSFLHLFAQHKEHWDDLGNMQRKNPTPIGLFNTSYKSTVKSIQELRDHRTFLRELELRDESKRIQELTWKCWNLEGKNWDLQKENERLNGLGIGTGK